MSFLTLDEYLTQAQKIMNAEKCGYLANDEDSISHVAYRMMLADQTWDGSKSSRETWRYSQAKYAILRLITQYKKKKKHNMQSLDYGWNKEATNETGRNNTLAETIPAPESDNIYEQFQEVCDLAENVLTGRQRECFNMYYQDRLSMQEIGDILGITKQTVSLHVIKGTKELRRCMSKLN